MKIDNLKEDELKYIKFIQRLYGYKNNDKELEKALALYRSEKVIEKYDLVKRTDEYFDEHRDETITNENIMTKEWFGEPGKEKKKAKRPNQKYEYRKNKIKTLKNKGKSFLLWNKKDGDKEYTKYIKDCRNKMERKNKKTIRKEERYILNKNINEETILPDGNGYKRVKGDDLLY